ncbi:hypothetical protein SAMN02745163_03937 [Clostridium cavendishii DSM 21758]|uniref:Uncharacterized protein n=1 Tax=Clostridium cavendishii DSM 21758 TaxID=1121302 RepID=A0A1M6T3C9_9CLOT|nr:hypothetical protein [Clostridium cavendishii]SHK51523.1 hypothetical protein SAMN02745163_03937 [Clostridium cavendishii DSM 21758]
MNISSITSTMNNYNMSSFFNTMSDPNSSKNIPLINSVDSYVQDSYTESKLNGISQNQELQNIFNTIEPTINTSSNIVPTSPTAFSDLQDSMEQGLINSLQGGSSYIDSSTLSIYNSIENGSYKPSSASIMTTNPYTMYNNVDSMQNQTQSIGNLLNTIS